MHPLSHIANSRRLKRQIEALRPKLYRLAWSWCRDEHLADDLVQDTLLRALQRITQLRDHNQLDVWVTRILINRHKDHLRSQKDRIVFDEEQLATQENPESELDRHNLIAQVREAVARLSDDQRKVLTLVDLMEFSYADVANALDIPVGTVMSRLSRARGRLKSLVRAPQHRTPVTPLRRVK